MRNGLSDVPRQDVTRLYHRFRKLDEDRPGQDGTGTEESAFFLNQWDQVGTVEAAFLGEWGQ